MKIKLDIRDEHAAQFLDYLSRLDFVRMETVEEPAVTFQSTLSLPALKILLNAFFSKNDLVEKAWIFGSFARQEQGPESDIDLMIRFTADKKIDLWDFVGLKQELEEVLNLPVDLVREGGEQSTRIGESIEKDKQLVYERETPRP